jgi:hypothetical protein
MKCSDCGFPFTSKGCACAFDTHAQYENQELAERTTWLSAPSLTGPVILASVTADTHAAAVDAAEYIADHWARYRIFQHITEA